MSDSSSPPTTAACGLLAFLLLGISGPAGAAEDDGRLGIRYRAIDEGLVVTAVSEGMGAAAAGIAVGSLLVDADGTSLRAGAESHRSKLVGPVGSTVRLSVIPPLQAKTVQVEVTRQKVSAGDRRSVAPRPPEVLAYRRAVRSESRRKAVAAARAMVAADFGGMQPGEAVGSSLATAKQRGDRFAREVALALMEGAAEDVHLQQGLARVLLNTGEAEKAKHLLESRSELVPPDVILKGGASADVGGNFQARALWIDALVELGERSTAAEASRALFETHRDPAVAALTGMALEEPTIRWTAELPPVAGFSLPLLDGTTWSSEEQRGKVVVVNFWATWCGPCKRELPELAELYRRRGGDGVEVLAVSTDTGPIEPVEEMAKKLELPFSVGRAPELSESFGVSALPAIRVLGPGGALHYSARGFSEGAMEKLDLAIDQAMEAGSDGGSPLASVWGREAERIRLRAFFPVAGALGVAAFEDGVAVGALEASPTRFSLDGAVVGEASVASRLGQPGTLMGWSDGPVAADPGKLLVRKWDEDGLPEWVRTFPEPVLDLVVTPQAIWVAGVEHVYALDSAGTLLHSEAAAVTDLSIRGDGAGVIGIGPEGRFRGSVAVAAVADGVQSPADDAGSEAPLEAMDPPAPVPLKVDVDVEWRAEASEHPLLTADGDVAGAVARHVVSGRFGPGGARRVAVVRADDRLVVLTPEGTVEAVVELRKGGPMAVADFDGDGVDSLLVTIPDHGVAWLELDGR